MDVTVGWEPRAGVSMGSTVQLRPRRLRRPLPYHQLDLDSPHVIPMEKVVIMAQLGVWATKARSTTYVSVGLVSSWRPVDVSVGGQPCSWTPVDVSVGLMSSWDPVTWDGKHYPQAVGQPWPAWGSRVGRLGASRLHILQVV